VGEAVRARVLRLSSSMKLFTLNIFSVIWKDISSKPL
jgi:hypothetical protein